MVFAATFAAQALATTTTEDSIIVKPPITTRFTEVGGVHLGYVKKVFQASNGFIWLGTNLGLMRFDGYEVKVYRHNNDDPSSIAGDNIIDIVEDKNHFLWLAISGKGISKFDPSTETFSQFKHDATKPYSMINDNVIYLAWHTDNELTVGTFKGLNLFNINNHQSRRLPLSTTIEDLQVRRSLTDQQGRLWIATSFHGLFRYDPLRKTTRHYRHQADNLNSLSADTIYGLALDDNDKLWIGTGSGLNQLDLKNDVITRLEHPSPLIDDLLKTTITALHIDSQGMVWAGTMDKGALRFNPKNNQFTPVDIGNEPIFDIFADSANLIWFGTMNGIVKLHPDALNFKHLSYASDKSLEINDIILTDDNTLWLSGQHLFECRQYQQHCTKIFNNIKARGIESHQQSLYFSHMKETDNHYIARYDRPLKTLTNAYAQLKQLPHNDSVFPHVLHHHDGVLFYTVRSAQSNKYNGLFSVNLASGKEKSLFTGSRTYNIAKLPPSNLYIATGQGLLHHDISSSTNRFVPKNSKTRYTFITLHKNNQDQLWLSDARKGLALFDPAADRLDYYPWRKNRINSIVEDNQGGVWLGTASGLVRFDRQQKTFTPYGKSHGLSDLSYNNHDALKTPTGSIILATNDGFIHFDPDKLLKNQAKAQTVITDFKLMNQSVKPDNVSPDAILQKSISDTDEITLSHQDYLFSFSFASLDYQSPESLQYSYTMQGLDDKWYHTDAKNRTATYTTLPPGDYTFRVKGRNNLGEFNQGAAIKVHILPPFWATTTAFVGYVLALIALIFLSSTIRTKRLNRRAKLLEKSIKQRTMELQQRANTISDLLEDKNQLLADKDRLIANISHEFRTPLTLILGPLEAELKTTRSKTTRSMLALAKANGQRLLAMVDQLLDIARLQEQQPTQVKNVLATCRFLLASYRSLATQRDLVLTLDNQLEEDVFVDMQPDALEKILSNLLTNAFKYTPVTSDKQQIVILMVKLNMASLIEISITDSGEGIQSDMQQQIFERFTRLDNAQGYVPGAGIGLALVKDLVEQHQGSISVQSAPGEGSTFTVTLPQANQSNQSSEINETLVLSAVDQMILNQPPDSFLDADNALYTDNDSPAIEGRRANILVIEDNYDMRQYLISCLNKDFHCLVATDGEAGVHMAQEHLPDLIISDVMMPKMDGFAVTRLLKTEPCTNHIPIILLTAHGDKQSRLKGLSEKADEFLQKPFDSAELLMRINNLLSIRSLLRQRFGQNLSEPRLPGLRTRATDKPDITNEDGEPENKQAPSQPENRVHQAFFEQIHQLLEQHYSDGDFGVGQLADEMALSKRQFTRKMKALMDLTPAEAIRNYRLKKAAEQLASGVTPSEVYYQTGFSSHSYFSQCFKARYQCLPSAYMQRIAIE